MFKYAFFVLLTLCLFWLQKAKCKKDELQFWERESKYSRPSLSLSGVKFNQDSRKRADGKHRRKSVHIQYLDDDSEELRMREQLPSHGQNELNRGHRRDSGPGVPPEIDHRQEFQVEQRPSHREFVDRGGLDLQRRKKPKINFGNPNTNSIKKESSGEYLEIEDFEGLTYNLTIGYTGNGQGHSRGYRQKQKEKSRGVSIDFFQDKLQRPSQAIPTLKRLTDFYQYNRGDRTTKDMNGKIEKMYIHFQKHYPDQRNQSKKEKNIWIKPMKIGAQATTSDRYQHDKLAKNSKHGRTRPKNPEHRSSRATTPMDIKHKPKQGSRFKIRGPTKGRDHKEVKELDNNDFVQLGKSDRHHGRADQGRYKHTNRYGKGRQVHAEKEEHDNKQHRKPRYQEIYQREDQKKIRTKIDSQSEEYSGKGKVTQGLYGSNDEEDKKGRYKSDEKLLRLSEFKMLSPHSIASQLQRIAKKFENKVTIQQEVIGRTVEYNDIVLWKMTKKDYYSEPNFRASANKYADDKAEKQIVFIVHGLTIMGWHNLDCLSKIKRFQTLLSYYIKHLSNFDIYLIPMANPDGVTKAFHNNFWNKNMSPQASCLGVHLDRNFDVAWNKYSSLNTEYSSCSHLYPGVMPFSELETQAIKSVFQRYSHRMVAYLHVHAGSYDSSVLKGDAVLYPKGYTDTQSDDDKYVDLRGEIDEAMRNASFKVISVTVDNMHHWYGKVNGTSVDYASSVFGIPYAMELVMQIYKDDMMVSNSASREMNSALTEIWKPVLHCIFEQIYKNTIKPNERK